MNKNDSLCLAISDLYPEPLSEQEAKEAGDNLMRFMRILVDVDLEQKRKQKETETLTDDPIGNPNQFN